MRATLLALLVLAIAPAGASAGGFATVGLSSTPDGIAPGEPWVVDLTILQHGQSDAPLAGVKPSVTVSSGGERRTFPATPTGRTGVYRARVVFPSAGTWTYRVNDGFGHPSGVAHDYPPVRIGGGVAPAAGGSGPDVGLALFIAGLAGLGVGMAAWLLRRPRGAGRPAEA